MGVRAGAEQANEVNEDSFLALPGNTSMKK